MLRPVDSGLTHELCGRISETENSADACGGKTAGMR
jgi:hypothetical protein